MNSQPNSNLNQQLQHLRAIANKESIGDIKVAKNLARALNYQIYGQAKVHPKLAANIYWLMEMTSYKNVYQQEILN